MFCRTRCVRCEHTQATTQQHKMTMTSDSAKQTVQASVKDKREAPADTAKSAVQDLYALIRKADVVSDCAFDASKLSAGLSELIHTVDSIYDELFDKLLTSSKEHRTARADFILEV